MAEQAAPDTDPHCGQAAVASVGHFLGLVMDPDLQPKPFSELLALTTQCKWKGAW